MALLHFLSIIIFTTTSPSMTLKYHKELTALGCQLLEYSERDNRDCCCWAFDPIEDKGNFVPRAIASPELGTTCTRYGLSFFETLEKARKRMLRLEMKAANIRLKLGTHIAVGILNKQDGISENAGKSGHFNHFEYEGAIELQKIFKIKEPI